MGDEEVITYEFKHLVDFFEKFKKDEKVSDVFAASDYIKVIYSVNNNNDFIGYEAKNGPIKIIIEEIK